MSLPAEDHVIHDINERGVKFTRTEKQDHLHAVIYYMGKKEPEVSKALPVGNRDKGYWDEDLLREQLVAESRNPRALREIRAAYIETHSRVV